MKQVHIWSAQLLFSEDILGNIVSVMDGKLIISCNHTGLRLIDLPIRN